MMKHLGIKLVLGIALCTVANACSTDNNNWGDLQFPNGDNQGGMGGITSSGSSAASESIKPTFDASISQYDGTMAQDAALDVVGTDADFYWEANKFTNIVSINYNGSSATVTSNNDDIITDINGGYVTVDFQTNAVSNVEIVLTGSTDDGALKVYGAKKFKLTLNGVSIKSAKGPAINNQCKKRMFVYLANGTTNSLEDASSYQDDTYYIDGNNADSEDRKGCFFSEANMIFSGTGSLSVAGNMKHGIATDGYFWMRPGVTLVITKAEKNAIQVKGDSDDGIGATINGGYIYANVASEAGKCIKSDIDVVVNGGVLNLNTSGKAIYDSDEKDTSSAAGIKTDGNIHIVNGSVTCRSTGMGGKGFNADGKVIIDGGTVTIATSGTKYSYSNKLTSSPKGIKADGDITINGGTLSIAVTGTSDGSEGLESKANLTINDGEIYVYAYDDAINAATDITVNGGKIFAYGINNDGIDSNGTININGGLIFSSGTSSPEEGIDSDSSSRFKINGGTVIGVGGSAVSPSSASKQRCVVINNLSASSGSIYAINDAAGNTIAAFAIPRTYSQMGMLFSSGSLTSATYTVLYGATISGQSGSWYGYYSDGTVSGGQTATTFTASSTITTVGQSSGMGGGMGGFGW
jgi:hypothetical protein